MLRSGGIGELLLLMNEFHIAGSENLHRPILCQSLVALLFNVLINVFLR